MGFMRWQVVHQKAKNSTNCGLPAARFTVAGSVGVNSVLMAGAVAETASVGALAGWVGAGPWGAIAAGAGLAAAQADNITDSSVVNKSILRILSPPFSAA
jgi:hypothetical protein